MWLLILLAFVAWGGHAFSWTTILNYVYARPYPKPGLRLWRHFTSLIILAFPALLLLTDDWSVGPQVSVGFFLAALYVVTCFGFGYVSFLISVHRWLHNPPAA